MSSKFYPVGNRRFSFRAFSLVELLVVVAVFALVFAIVVGLFVTSLRNQKNLLARQEIMDEISYVMEYMSRSLRMAKINNDATCLFVSDKNYYSSGSNITFKNYKGECQKFYLQDGELKEEKEGTINGLTSDNIQINSFNINLVGESRISDNLQPKVTLFLDVQHKKQTEVKLQIQTTISQRNLDYE